MLIKGLGEGCAHYCSQFTFRQGFFSHPRKTSVFSYQVRKHSHKGAGVLFQTSALSVQSGLVCILLYDQLLGIAHFSHISTNFYQTQALGKMRSINFKFSEKIFFINFLTGKFFNFHYIFLVRFSVFCFLYLDIEFFFGWVRIYIKL